MALSHNKYHLIWIEWISAKEKAMNTVKLSQFLSYGLLLYPSACLQIDIICAIVC